jgi:uncharacterized membrane protein YphA (DoxX/SURF4 family)
VSTFIRLALAMAWLASGVLAAANPGQAHASVQAYGLLPGSAVSLVAAVLPFVELSLGLLLLIGVATRVMAALSILLVLLFLVGSAQAWGHTWMLDLSGGGPGFTDLSAFGLELIRDSVLLLLAGWLLRWPPSRRGGLARRPAAGDQARRGRSA